MANQVEVDDEGLLRGSAVAEAERASDGGVDGRSGMRSIVFPSPQFPGPPAVGLDVPERWLPVTPETYLRFGPKVDLAVVGPAVVDGLRPSLVVSTTRTEPSNDPQRLLADLVMAAGDEGRLRRGSFANRGDHVCHVVGYEDIDDGRPVRRLQCLIYSHNPLVAHVITVIGSVAAGDEAGMEELSAMLGTVRISQTSPSFADFAEVDHV